MKVYVDVSSLPYVPLHRASGAIEVIDRRGNLIATCDTLEKAYVIVELSCITHKHAMAVMASDIRRSAEYETNSTKEYNVWN